MAIALRDSTSNSGGDGANVAVDLTGIASLAEDDIVILAYEIADNAFTNHTMAIAVGTGWTKIADLWDRATYDSNFGLFWKLMGATPDTSVTVTGTADANSSIGAVAMAFSGVDQTTPFDVTTTTDTGSGTADADPPSINHNNPAGVVTVIAAGAPHTRGAGATFTMPTGYVTNNEQITGDDNEDAIVAIGYDASPSDPEDPGALAFSNDNAGFAWCAATMALRPAASGLAAVLGFTITLKAFDKEIDVP